MGRGDLLFREARVLIETNQGFPNGFCAETGEVFLMTDDGHDGDLIAGDGVFCGMASFASEEEKELTFHLVVNGSQMDPATGPARIRFYQESAAREEISEIDRIGSELDRITREFRMTGKEEEDVARYRETLDKVKAALDQMVAEQRILSYDVDLPDICIRLPIGAFYYTFDVAGSDRQADGSDDTVSEYVIADEEQKMLVMLPYDGDLNSLPFIEGLRTIAGADR